MLPFAYYLLKVTICSAVLFGYYWFFLRNKVFHSYNRFYLLAVIVLSMLLPLMKFDVFYKADEPAANVIKILQVVNAGDEYMDEIVVYSSYNNISKEQVAGYIYFAITLALLFMLARVFVKIRHLLKKYPVLLLEGIHFIMTREKGTPFSFFKFIFWNEAIDINSSPGRQVLKHEMAHIHEKHSHDKLFLNIILAFFWCNPVFWLIRKELTMIHEFIADKKAIEDGDTSAFASMILQATYPTHRFQIANNFFYSPIKRRLLMLTRKHNPALNYISRLLILPVLLFVVAAFTLKAKTYSTIQVTDKIFTVVIDAGHGGEDHGAKGVDGALEKDINLALVKKIKELNQNRNIKLVFAREHDVYHHPKGTTSFAKSVNADLLISIHVETGPNTIPTSTGMKVWVAKDQYQYAEQSKLFASAIITTFKNNYALPVASNPLQRKMGIWVLQEAGCPAILIESGDIRSKTDVEYLRSGGGQEKFAKNVLQAIESYRQDQHAFQYSTKFIDTIPQGMYVNVKHTDQNFLKSDEFKSKALVIVDSKEIGNLGNNYIENGNVRYSSIVVYNPTEAKKVYGEKGRHGVIKLTQKDATYITADSFYYDKKNNLIKLSGNTIVKGDLSTSLIYINGKIASPVELNAIPPSKIISIDILKGDKLDGIIEASGKTALINVSLKPDDLQEVVVLSNRTTSIQPDVSITSVNGDRLFIGVENSITIASPTIPAYKLEVSISNGSLTGSNGKYVARVTNVGETIISVSHGGKLIATKVFKMLRLGDPILALSGISNTRIDIAELKNISELHTISKDFKIASATVYFSGAGFTNVVSVLLNGGSLKSLNPYLDRVVTGTVITFDDVRISIKEGSKLTIIGGKSFTFFNNNMNDNTNRDANMVFNQMEVSPSFPGGQEAWSQYLNKNLNANVPVQEGWKAGTYQVMVKFIVDTKGNVTDVTTQDYPGSKTSQMCTDLIKNGPKWIPGVQNGYVVNGYKKQPITFVVSEE